MFCEPISIVGGESLTSGGFVYGDVLACPAPAVT